MNREEQIKKAHDLLSEGKFEEARSLVDAIKKHDAEELENKASEEQPEEDKIVEETKDEEKESEPEEQLEEEQPEEEQPEEQQKDERKTLIRARRRRRKYGKSSVRWKRNLSARNRSSWIFKLCTFSQP